MSKDKNRGFKLELGEKRQTFPVVPPVVSPETKGITFMKLIPTTDEVAPITKSQVDESTKDMAEDRLAQLEAFVVAQEEFNKAMKASFERQAILLKQLEEAVALGAKHDEEMSARFDALQSSINNLSASVPTRSVMHSISR